MKIKEIKKVEGTRLVYEITFRPNWIEKIFGVKEKVKKFKDTGKTYALGGQSVYIDESGDELGNYSYISESIDRWKRRW